ncbi:MAG: cold shock domain-containing protein [Bacteroidaceae bacterium]|nr:cold shock domain-containing protein [Bacteroidaceae bacterium]
MKGTIELYDKGHGFGFVVGENGTEYYTKFDGLSPEEKAKAEKGMPISFELQEGLRGEEAVNVKLL